MDDQRVEKGIKLARVEMDELEELMTLAGVSREGKSAVNDVLHRDSFNWLLMSLSSPPLPFRHT